MMAPSGGSGASTSSEREAERKGALVRGGDERGEGNETVHLGVGALNETRGETFPTESVSKAGSLVSGPATGNETTG